MDGTLITIGFRRSKADPCVYIKGSGQSCDIVLTYVDGICILSPNETQMNAIVQQLRKHFKVRDLGELQNYVGVNFQKTPTGGYIWHQRNKLDLQTKDKM